MNRFCLFATLSAALALASAGCHHPTAPPSPETGPASPVTQTAPPATTSPTKLVVYVINPKATGSDDLLIAHSIPLHHPEAPAQDALTALLQASHSPIAPGTTLRGLSVDNGVATLDFSQSPVNETGGESAQSAALNALAMTLGQFPSINTYQIKVKGTPDKAFGEFTADGPMDVIRPGGDTQAKGSGQ